MSDIPPPPPGPRPSGPFAVFASASPVLLYTNESGEPLTRDAWFAWFIDPSAHRPQRFSSKIGVDVELSFLGIASTLESPPRPWLVEASREVTRMLKDGSNVKTREQLAEHWEADKDAALLRFEELKAKARKGWPIAEVKLGR